MSQNLSQQLRALRAGEITFTAFHRGTREDWRRMAIALHRRYSLPPSCSPEDVEQEMLFGAYIAVGKWEERRASLVGYVVWSAHSRATKWVHRQRGVEQHTCKGPSRFALNASSIAREDGTSVLDDATTGWPDSERQLDLDAALEKVASFSADQSEAQRKALEYYVDLGADVDRAAARLWEHGPLLRLRDREHAREVVCREVARLRHAVMGHDENHG